MRKLDNIGLMLGIFLISVSTLAFELLQTRILSVIYWNHLVYITVTIALLGFGISGAFLSIFPRRILSKVMDNLVLFSLGYSFSLAICVALSAKLRVFGSNLHILTKLLISYNLLLIPFFFSGLIIAASLTKFTGEINRLYFVNLAGSGLGCLLFIFAMEPLGVPQLVFALAVIGVASAFFFSINAGRKMKIAASFSLIILLGLVPFSNYLIEVLPEGYKQLGKYTNKYMHPEAKIEYTKWTPISRIDVSSDNNNHLLKHLFSVNHFLKDLQPFSPNDYKVITVDGDAITPIYSSRLFNGLVNAAKCGTNTGYFNSAYLLRENPEVLVIGMGGGIDVMSAIAFNARKITAVEIDNAIYDLTTNKYTWFSGLNFRQKNISAYDDEGRSFVKRSDERYDIIQINAIDTFAALSSGAYVLSENYLYTVEAFLDYFRHLKDEGILSINRWFFIPPRETLRLSSIAMFAYQKMDVDNPEKHILIIGDKAMAWATTLFKKSAFTPEEMNKIRSYSDKYSHPIIFFPKIYPLEEQLRLEQGYYSQIGDQNLLEVSRVFNRLFTTWRQERIEAFYNNYRYNVRPVFDDNPFFFEYNRIIDLYKIKEVTIRGDWPLFTLYFLLLMTLLAVIFLIILPLYRFKKQGLRTPRVASTCTYFISLGVGFMFIEIGLMQKLVLFLGHPIYSISVVLSSLLIFSGLGSYASSLLAWRKEKIIRISVILISSILLIYTGIISYIVNHFLEAGLTFRVLLSLALLAPLSFFMGMPFPSGLKKIEKDSPGLIPWAWGVNGGASVLASILCIIIAMWFGFISTLIVAAAVYLIGMLVFLNPLRKELTMPA